jgi:plasmid stability protein
MTILHVRGVPAKLHQKLKRRAKTRKRSLSAEIIRMLSEAIEQDERAEQIRTVLARIDRIRASTRPPAPGEPTAVDMLREDRAR